MTLGSLQLSSCTTHKLATQLLCICSINKSSKIQNCIAMSLYKISPPPLNPQDLSDEAVLQSLQTLTSLLAHHHSYHHQHHTLTGPGTRGVALETSSCEPALSKSGTVSPGLLSLTDSTHVYTCIQFTRRNTCSCIHSHRAHINHTKSYTDVYTCTCTCISVL